MIGKDNLLNRKTHNIARTINCIDVLVMLLFISIVMLSAYELKQMTIRHDLSSGGVDIQLDIISLVVYTTKTFYRILVAICFSTVTAIFIGYLIAKNKICERILMPIIDVLQSVPILSFLSLAVMFMCYTNVNSKFNPEIPIVFAIFTSQVWNMIFSVYQSIKSMDNETKECMQILNLSRILAFIRIELPCMVPSLVWNIIVSMSSSWFFVTASETLIVLDRDIRISGIGSYIATAIDIGNIRALIYAVIMLILTIYMCNKLIFNPILYWSDKYSKNHSDTRYDKPMILEIFHNTHFITYILKKISWYLGSILESICHAPSVSHMKQHVNRYVIITNRNMDINKFLRWKYISMILVSILSIYAICILFKNYNVIEIERVFWSCIYTMIRVFIVLITSSLIWLPIGIFIGMNKKLSSKVNPIMQFFVSFPVNILFPIFVIIVQKYHINAWIWSIFIMSLGTQWYILFNIIAGASNISQDLVYVSDLIRISQFKKIIKCFIPSIMPYFLTGLIAASGGAWNTSIVAELINWKEFNISADGIGSYISIASSSGNIQNVVIGTSIMCIFILIVNIFIWKPLYAYTIKRFT